MASLRNSKTFVPLPNWSAGNDDIAAMSTRFVDCSGSCEWRVARQDEEGTFISASCE